MDQDPCELKCGTHATTSVFGDILKFECRMCGTYKLTGTAGSLIRKYKHLHKVRAWVFEQNRSALTPTISEQILDWLEAQPDIPLVEKADRLLLEAVREQSSFGEEVNTSDRRFEFAIRGRDSQEVGYVRDMLKSRGYLQQIKSSKHDRVRVTPEGYIRSQELRSSIDSNLGFVAMWFDSSMHQIYEDGFAAGIRNAGFEPFRVDQSEHVGKIDDEIIASIRRARFVVADFTGHRGGVYFEAGFALGLGRDVIWTCKDSDLKSLHFDIRQYNFIQWNEAADLALRIERRIRALP